MLTCLNKCSSQSHVLFCLKQHTTLGFVYHQIWVFLHFWKILNHLEINRNWLSAIFFNPFLKLCAIDSSFGRPAHPLKRVDQPVWCGVRTANCWQLDTALATCQFLMWRATFLCVITRCSTLTGYCINLWKLDSRVQWGLEFWTRSELGWSIVVRFSPDHWKTELWLA